MHSSRPFLCRFHSPRISGAKVGANSARTMAKPAQNRHRYRVRNVLLRGPVAVSTHGVQGKAATAPQVYCSHSSNVELFDLGYLTRLKQRDPETLTHFAHHFNRALKCKLRAARFNDTD